MKRNKKIKLSKIAQATKELAEKIAALVPAPTCSLEGITKAINPFVGKYNLQPFETEIVAGNLCGGAYSC